MTEEILDRDSDIRFPNLTVLRASAGSGKTHALTKRFVQFILSDRVPKNGLRNILAITFSNNAAKEMKKRVLEWLKGICTGDENRINEMLRTLSITRETLISRAGRVLDYIYSNYSDFQVKTIDSFMTTIFKSTAIDFGFNPEFDILIDNNELVDYAFNLFMRRVREGTEEAVLLEEVIPKITENRSGTTSYIWNPYRDLLAEIKELYRKISSTGRSVMITGSSKETDRLKGEIVRQIQVLERLIEESGLEISRSSSYLSVRDSVKNGRFTDLLEKGLKNYPVKKPPARVGGEDHEYYRKIQKEWDRFSELVSSLVRYHCSTYYLPYLRVYRWFEHMLERTKRIHGKGFIEDVNFRLSEYMDDMSVPDVYFRIGETIFHYLIDEFQDTSPVQWNNLTPLIENSLAQNGSLFVVGDTKQAIYGFRDADFRIMKEIEMASPFPSAVHVVRELFTNYRSYERILDFNERMFRDIIKESEYSKYAEMSGLTSYTQDVRKENRGKGYVETNILVKDSVDPEERRKIQEIIGSLKKRGYDYRDIATLTPRNEDVVRISSWLNESGIPFISFSSLDVRRRKITGEIVALLNFLDSPLDDLSFATFILGEIFRKASNLQSGLHDFLLRNRENPPLYKAFQAGFSDLWGRYFEGLFNRAGYLPLYDLVTEVFKVFNLYEAFKGEEATLTRILEVIKKFEEKGTNSLKDFLTFAHDSGGDAEWNINVPGGIDAVNVMTIHKAKGLGFPVTIVLLYEERLNKGFPYIVKEEGGRTSILRINRKTSLRDPEYGRLYEEELTKQWINSLNSLYVGFTRAVSEMYVIGVKSDGGKKDGYPVSLLPVADFSPTERPDEIYPHKAEISERIPVYQTNMPLELPVSSSALLSPEEKRRGELIHEILYHIDYIGDDPAGDIQTAIDQALSTYGGDIPGLTTSADRLKGLITGFLERSEIREFFIRVEGRKVLKEQEFSDGMGRLFRMDRVIVDRDRVTVIDFKTGRVPETDEAKYVRQVKNYVKILRDIYPGRDVEGLLAYIDAGGVRRLE
jgi:ATP-dependent exoDNAse (exonuclease V) beta subunit